MVELNKKYSVRNKVLQNVYNAYDKKMQNYTYEKWLYTIEINIIINTIYLCERFRVGVIINLI